MEIQCDKCKQDLDFAPEIMKNDDIEYMFFRCPNCGAVFPICASDSALRKDIGKYTRMRMVIKSIKVSKKYINDAEQLKQQNIKRSHELMEQYPLVHFLSHE